MNPAYVKCVGQPGKRTDCVRQISYGDAGGAGGGRSASPGGTDARYFVTLGSLPMKSLSPSPLKCRNLHIKPLVIYLTIIQAVTRGSVILTVPL